ncbi:hypothetical protein ALPO108162_13025 [Alicyclobacillus pomorum]
MNITFARDPLRRVFYLRHSTVSPPGIRYERVIVVIEHPIGSRPTEIVSSPISRLPDLRYAVPFTGPHLPIFFETYNSISSSLHEIFTPIL